MNEDVINYHKQRRPFIIIPGTGIILGESGQPFAHLDILLNLGLSEAQAKEIIENFPRGYFLDNKLVLYQLDNVEEGCCWILKQENYDNVKKYFQDLKKIFSFNPQTRVFLGVKRGKIGEIWQTVDEVNLDFFE